MLTVFNRCNFLTYFFLSGISKCERIHVISLYQTNRVVPIVNAALKCACLSAMTSELHSLLMHARLRALLNNGRIVICQFFGRIVATPAIMKMRLELCIQEGIHIHFFSKFGMARMQVMISVDSCQMIYVANFSSG